MRTVIPIYLPIMRKFLDLRRDQNTWLDKYICTFSGDAMWFLHNATCVFSDEAMVGRHAIV